MTLEYINCNLCGADEPKILIRRESANIVKCKKCGLIYVNPRRVESERLQDIILDGVGVEHKKIVWYDSKLNLFKHNIEKIKQYYSIGKLLDIGCGYGIFLKIAQDNGFQVQGLEISQSACKYAREKLGLKISERPLRETSFPDDYFDIVTLWDIVNLFSNPKEEFKEVKRILKEEGLAAIRVQNANFHVNIHRLLRGLGNFQARFNLNPTIIHPYIFSPDTISRLLEAAGFKDIKVYVSEFTSGDPYSTAGVLGALGMRIIKKAIYHLCQVIFYATGGQLILSSSMLVFARKKSRLKVLHIITRLDKGGSAENTLLTVSNLDKEKFNATLMSGPTNDPDKKIADYIAKQNINYILVPDLEREINPWKDLKAFFSIHNFIKKERFNLVHTHTSKAGIIGRWAAKLAGVKMIVHTPHGHIFYGYFGWLKTKLFIYLERITAVITDKIITLTQRGKEEHLRYRIANENKFVPIYSGIDLKKYADFKIDKIQARQNLHIPSDIAFIGTVTRLDPIKGNKYFINALVQVFKVFPELKVAIVGEGSEKEELRRYVKQSGLSEKITFMGLCEDIRGILSALDIMVIPSLNEGMGRSLLEAQALGIPVIATNVGGIPEVVKDGMTGILVPPRDSPALARAIIKLLKDRSLREKMGEEARKWVDQRFSAETMVKKVADLYEKLKCLEN